MTVKVAEAGRKLSAASKTQIKTVLDLLGDLYGEDDSVEGQPVSEAVIPLGPTPTLQDVKKHMMMLIKLIPNAQTREALEGDGDGDDDPDALFSGMDGDPLTTTPTDESVRKSFIELLAEATLTTATRNNLPSSAFVFPKTREYPIHNAAHASNALARAKGKTEEPIVRAAVKKKWPNLPAFKNTDAKEAGIKCADCGSPVGKYDSYCGNCGSGLSAGYGSTTAHCVGCGNSLNSDSAFCPSCGTGTDNSLTAKGKDDKAAKTKESRAAHPDWKFSESMKPHDPEAFANLSPTDQREHMLKEHGVASDSPNITKPARRLAQHTHDHAFDEAEDIELTTDFVELKERAIGKDGNMLIKMISPGWGSSGYYGRTILERDMPFQFPKGTKMYADHPTVTEEKDRPERSIKDIVAVVESDPKYLVQGPDGEGVYCKAKPIGDNGPFLEGIAPHVGVSIRASGRSRMGEAEGKKGPIIEAITKGHSCDFVTEPGRGGSISQLLESARARINNNGTEADNTVSDAELAEARKQLNEVTAERDKLRTRLLMRDARAKAGEILSRVNIPDISKRRIAESASNDPPTDAFGDLDVDKFKTVLREACRDEATYLQEVAPSGRVRGLGRENRNWDRDEEDDPLDFFDGSESRGRSRRSSVLSNDDDDDDSKGDEDSAFTRGLSREFAGLGIKESTAKIAAAGRA